MIKILSFVTLLLILFNVMAFYASQDVSTNNKEQRTRIIAGMPVNEKDYKLAHQPERKNQTQNYF